MKNYYVFCMLWCWGFAMWSARGLLVRANPIDIICLSIQLLVFGVSMVLYCWETQDG